MTDEPANVWEGVLAQLRDAVDTDEFRRWFEPTSYGGDSGDQITVWVPTEVIRRHLQVHFQNDINQALDTMGRTATHVRFVVTGVGEEDDE